MRTRENAGVNGEYFRRKANLKRIFTFFELMTKKRKKGRQKFLPGK